MKSAIAACAGVFWGAAAVYVLPGLIGSGWALVGGVQLLLIAAGVRVDMPRLSTAAALVGLPLLVGAGAHLSVR